VHELGAAIALLDGTIAADTNKDAKANTPIRRRRNRLIFHPNPQCDCHHGLVGPDRQGFGGVVVDSRAQQSPPLGHRRTGGDRDDHAVPDHRGGQRHGSEFINHHLLDWCVKREITFTRARPSNSNDGAYVEQKNWAVVRTVVGYHRYDTPAETRVAEQDLGAAVAADQLLLPAAEANLHVTLFYFLDLSVADVAQVLGCSVGTVKSALADARVRLRIIWVGSERWIWKNDCACSASHR